jgi:hypothetical protein
MTCPNKALPGGCPLHNVHCGYPKCDEDPVKPEMVNHPKHYNSHASGVEAISLCRLLPFNMGNALKYVMRRDDKGTAKQDLQKALWYLRDEDHCWQASALIINLVDALSLAKKLLVAETHPQAKHFYATLHGYLMEQKETLPTGKAIQPIIEAVEELLATY